MGQLKTNELTIGDLVYVTDEKNVYRRITGLKETRVAYNPYEGEEKKFINRFYGIPLTEEILLLNGFAIEKLPNRKIYRKKDIELFELGGGIATRIANSLTEIPYVHTLQHILRLACMSDEIRINSKKHKIQTL